MLRDGERVRYRYGGARQETCMWVIGKVLLGIGEAVNSSAKRHL
jgi:hypothetical protein